MEVVHDYPPLFDEIDAAFHVRGRSVVFAWGDRIYCPQHGVIVPPEILAHEAVHGERQGTDIVGWWRRYIDDPRFRLAEEIPAHRAECNWLLEHGNGRQRRAAVKQVAAKLAAPLYGRVITRSRARALLSRPDATAYARAELERDCA